MLLHDHLDGGLRPRTVIDLAAEIGYRDLPTTDPDELAAVVHVQGPTASRSSCTSRVPRTPSAVMQTRDAIERVGAECVEDLAADGIVYAEVRLAPELPDRWRPDPRRGGGRDARRVPTAARAGRRSRSG